MVAPSSTRDRLVLRRTLAAVPQTVFQIWTEPEHMKNWFAPSSEYTNPFIEVDLREGGSYRVAFESAAGQLSVVGGRYVTVLPPHKLVFTWQWEGPHEFEDRETLVSVEFLDRDGGTELVLTHERFPDPEMLEKHQWGWAGALERLQQAIA